MKTIQTSEDIFSLPDNAEVHYACCVTTNGIIKSNGCAVMGAGVALRANQLYHVDKRLAYLLKIDGNHCRHLETVRNITNGVPFELLSFPTKNHFKDKSSILLITQSCIELIELCNTLKLDCVYLTPPGCGNGGLNWENEVKPVVSKYLDDRITIVLKE